MDLIGREREKRIIEQCLESKRPEFVVVYGRRRVGKTYLIREYFNNKFAFYATGLSDEKTGGQLKAFHESLIKYGDTEKARPKDWFEAFSRLMNLISQEDAYKDPVSGKHIIFLDELPWMDTPRSDFKSALDYFWNSWASARSDIVLIVCGSATSWIIENLIKNTKGFHNRITKRIHLMPFSLLECSELLESNGMIMTRNQVMECYMVFGGIPYYLNILDSRLSLSQNIEELCFKEYSPMREEYSNLFYSLFKKPEKHLAIIEALATVKMGMTRTELAENKRIGGGSILTTNLSELEQCGFIRKYANYKKKNNVLYQLIDPFVLFSIKFIQSGSKNSWVEYVNTPGYNSWRGNAFEIVCLNHLAQIKAALGVEGVQSREYSWRSAGRHSGAQIDLIIDRDDGVVNICEMKYSNEEYVISREEYEKMQNRLTAFQKETKINKALHLTMISASGIKKNKYSIALQRELSGEDLFR